MLLKECLAKETELKAKAKEAELKAKAGLEAKKEAKKKAEADAEADELHCDGLSGWF